MKRVIVTVVALLALAPALLAEEGKKDLVAVDVPSANTQFACDLYARLAVEPGNVFISPYSISTALQMTWAGARGGTAKEMAATLHIPNEPALVHPAVGELIKKLEAASATKGIRVAIANRLYGQEGLGFLPDFLTLIDQSYGGGIERVDFRGHTEEARKTINAWVEKKTEDKIKDLLAKGDLTPATFLVLVNAIYFKGDWETPFDKKLTADAPWWRPGDQLSTTAALPPARAKLMNRTGTVRYFKGDGFQAVELPYAGKSLSMDIFLPDAPGGLPAFEKSLTSYKLAGWLKGLRNAEVALSLPKFTMTFRSELNEPLKALGMQAAFTSGDFSGMLAERIEGPTCISKVIHKAFVDVNEEGTEAAAATVVVMKGEAVSRPAVFKADHPFLLLIRDTATGTILFMGRVTDPTAKDPA